jgi:hypothetical protein
VWKDGKLENFELRFQYRIPTAFGNSGAQYRSIVVEEGADGPIQTYPDEAEGVFPR